MALVKMPTVEEEMKKNPELKTADLDMLREWHKKQPHLPPMTDAELVLFLHSNYYRIEPTKTTIDTFFTVRTHTPEFFANRDPLGCKELREIMKVGSIIPLPGTTPEGYKILISKIMDSDPSHFVLPDMAKLFCMILELWTYTAGTCPGYIIILDMNGIVFGHMIHVNLMLMKKHLHYLQEALPIRLKAFHIINMLPFMDVVLNAVKPFMKNEFINMLSIHSNFDSLKQKIPIELLPKDLGGEVASRDDLWAAHIQEIERHRDWYLEQDTRRVNEALRPDKATNAVQDIFGVQGSFKKLDID